MFGIPEWAIGVGFIVVAVMGGVALLYRLIPAEMRASERKRHLARALEHLQGELGGSDEMRHKLGELADVQRRVAELEERLDFAERLLAKQREVERLAPPNQ
jgi:predicted nuclease with TOPRIM domain